jgi:tRNA-specific 2-thiouridylase
MISEYKKGNTPNPDIMCNKEIKFGAFMKKALEMGADFVATGHYCRNIKLKDGSFALAKAKDPKKEQSYFLYTLTQNQLSKVIFPIGDISKSEVRMIAKKVGLPNSEKKDSQGICMLGDISIKDFLSHFIKSKKGDVLSKEGEVIGKHDGAVFLTVGERHGFIIDKKTPEDTRMYVMAKDVLKNTITVGHKEDLLQEEGMVTKEVNLEKVNWINILPEQKKIYDAQIRYHQTLQKATLENKNGVWTVHFKTPQTSATGQSVVIYDKDICLGGGIIV